MTQADRAPALGRLSFCCPHCGAFTSQQWWGTYAVRKEKDSLPFVPPADAFEQPVDLPGLDAQESDAMAERMRNFRDKMRAGEPFFDRPPQNVRIEKSVPNLFISECFVCDRLSLWVGESLVLPTVKRGAPPHPDTPSSIEADFQEARSIVNLSPRGAAALLRLAIQKLCVELGEPGRDLNTDIGSLVAKGLPVEIQQALDAVRVVGNEAVHPGELDLRDDFDTAEHLFELVNMIVEERISKPKRLAALYERLPTAKREAIVARNERAAKKP